LVAFYVLWRIYNQYRDRLLTGDMFLMYIAQYSFIRFLLEFLRVEVAVIGNSGINSSQAITVVAFVVSVALLIYRHRPGNFEAAKAADEQA
jgi:prolipoprotein diacylglyceryltransferase